MSHSHECKRDHCKKCCKVVECIVCKRGKRGPKGNQGPTGIQGIQGLTGPTGPSGGESTRESSPVRIITYNSQTDDPQVLIDATGPGDQDGAMGLAFATNNSAVIVFFWYIDQWRAFE